MSRSISAVKRSRCSLFSDASRSISRCRSFIRPRYIANSDACATQKKTTNVPLTTPSDVMKFRISSHGIPAKARGVQVGCYAPYKLGMAPC